MAALRDRGGRVRQRVLRQATEDDALSPHSAIITSVEFDHADIYDDWDAYRTAFEAFAATVSPEGTLALNGDDRVVRAESARILQPGSGSTACRMGWTSPPETFATGPADSASTSSSTDEIVEEIFFPMSGRHNLMNVLAVCTIALDEGVSPAVLADGIAHFRGMRRRQEIRGDVNGVLVIDDFAHHPTAVRETVRAIADRWPERRVVAVFEPRSNSSRRKVFEHGIFGGVRRCRACVSEHAAREAQRQRGRSAERRQRFSDDPRGRCTGCSLRECRRRSTAPRPGAQAGRRSPDHEQRRVRKHPRPAPARTPPARSRNRRSTAMTARTGTTLCHAVMVRPGEPVAATPKEVLFAPSDRLDVERNLHGLPDEDPAGF
jgi:hypothetical protein